MPEDLARRRVDDNRLRADVTKDLQEAELAGGVDLEVEAGPRHRLDVAHLPREVEDHLGRGRGVTDEPHVVDLRVDHVDRAGGVVEVAAIPAVGGYERVDHGHLGAARRERDREVRPDEAQPARDQAPTTSERREQGLVQRGQLTGGRVVCRARRGGLAPPSASRRVR